MALHSSAEPVQGAALARAARPSARTAAGRQVAKHLNKVAQLVFCHSHSLGGCRSLGDGQGREQLKALQELKERHNAQRRTRAAASECAVVLRKMGTARESRQPTWLVASRVYTPATGAVFVVPRKEWRQDVSLAAERQFIPHMAQRRGRGDSHHVNRKDAELLGADAVRKCQYNAPQAALQAGTETVVVVLLRQGTRFGKPREKCWTQEGGGGCGCGRTGEGRQKSTGRAPEV